MTGDGTRPTSKVARRYWTPWHIAAIVLAFIVAIIVFRFTGDADVMLAAGSGAGVGLVGWLLAHFHLSVPRDL